MEAKGASPSILDQYDARKRELEMFATELRHLLEKLLAWITHDERVATARCHSERSEESPIVGASW